jgi:hypothetical protein
METDPNAQKIWGLSFQARDGNSAGIELSVANRTLWFQLRTHAFAPEKGKC